MVFLPAVNQVFSPALDAQLATLTAALDDPGTDLHTILDVLVDDLSAAVPSFLGLTVTLQSEWFPITLTAIEPDRVSAASASVAFWSDPWTGTGPGGTIVLYAANPGAFVDLAADLQLVHGQDGRVVLDGDLPKPPDQQRTPGVTGLTELSVINQAIGVLITRGHTPEQARAELRRRAALCPGSPTEAAGQVLASTNAPPLHQSLDGTTRPGSS